MSECRHEWRQVHEEFLLVGHFPIGYECLKCGEWLEQSKLTPSGVPGKWTKQHRLVGPHGAVSQTADGKRFKEQIYDETTGKLTIVPPK